MHSIPLPVGLEAEFFSLAKEWRRDTIILSSIAKRAKHPAYQRIIGMGPSVIPLILRELKERPDHWFWALNTVTGVSPAESATTFDEARAFWLRWGRDQGFIK